MTPVTIGYIGIILLLVLVTLRFPIAFALAILGAAGIAWFYGIGDSLDMTAVFLFNRMASFTFTAVPLFLLMGYFAFHAGLTKDAYDTGRVWVGSQPGGLAMATILASALFAACSGSGVAAAAALGRIAIPEMLRFGYNKGLSSGTVAAGAPLAVLIPPSMVMVVYGILTNTSIGRLLIAGVIPGILCALVYMAGIYFLCRARPHLAPMRTETVTMRERLGSLRKVWGIIILFLLVMGSIYLGWATATEAAALGAAGALVLALSLRRLSWANFKDSLLETANVTGMIFLLLSGAFLFTVFLDLAGVVRNLTMAITAMDIPVWALVAVLCLLYILLGCFFDSISMMVLTMPFVLPVLITRDINTVWFGIIIVMLVEIGCLTPPMGLTVYVVKGVVGDTIELTEIFRGSFFFLVLALLVTVILIILPQISLWLPQLMKG